MTQKIICQLKCEFNDACQGNIDCCIVRTFNQVLLSLPLRSRQVIIMRYGLVNGEALSLAKIAKELFTTVSYVKELELRAIRRLQCPPYADVLLSTFETISTNNNSPYAKLFKAVFGIETINKDSIVIPPKRRFPIFRKSLTIVPKETLIEECGFYSRTASFLRINGIKTIGDLTELNVTQLSKIIPIKSRLFIEVYLTLDAMELRLADCPKDTFASVSHYLTDVLLVDKKEVASVEKILYRRCRTYRLVKIVCLIFHMHDTRDIAQLSRRDLTETLFIESEIEMVEAFLHKFNLNLALESESVSETFEYDWDDEK